MTIPVNTTSPYHGNRWNLGFASAMLAVDVGLFGSVVLSIGVCPIWLIVEVLKGAFHPSAWRPSLFKAAIPVVTLGLALVNAAVQYRIGEANAARIISACENFHDANGRFPQTLDELVPRYLQSIPRACYCYHGFFHYFSLDEIQEFSSGDVLLTWSAGIPRRMRLHRPNCGVQVPATLEGLRDGL